MKHLPHSPGVTDGFYNNWWQYIVNYDEAIRELPPPGATLREGQAGDVRRVTNPAWRPCGFDWG